MKFSRIYGVILRHFYLFRRSLDRLSDSFYWPAMDLLILGLTSSYFSSISQSFSPIILIIISGVILWLILWKVQYEISVSILEDLWNKNLINFFVSPLKFNEWIAAFIILGIIKMLVTFSFTSALAYYLYKIEIFQYGIYLIPFVLSLTLTGWWLGFLISGIILRFGTRMQTFAWTMPYALAPFSAAYYPVSILPSWAQEVAKIIPTSYIFEGAREVINTGSLDINKVLISFFLNTIYIIISLIFLKSSFNKVMQRGMVQLY